MIYIINVFRGEAPLDPMRTWDMFYYPLDNKTSGWYIARYKNEEEPYSYRNGRSNPDWYRI